MTPELEQLKGQLAALIACSARGLHKQIQDTEQRLLVEMQRGFERLDARLWWDEIICLRDQETAKIRKRLKRLE